MPGKLPSIIRCYVVAQTYQHFQVFCYGAKVSPGSADIVFINPAINPTITLRGACGTNSYFVFLANWYAFCTVTEQKGVLGRVNAITMGSNPPYKREL